MKRKDKESLKNMSGAELGAKLRDLEKNLFQIKFRRATSPLENPLEIRLIRRKIAVIKTVLGDQARAAASKTPEVKSK